METKVIHTRKMAVSAAILALIGGLALALGFAWSTLGPRTAFGAETQGGGKKSAGKVDGKQKILYPEKTELDFEGTQIEGELRNPGEFYFQHRTEEKFDSLVKRRKNFHREMLRDVVLSK